MECDGLSRKIKGMAKLPESELLVMQVIWDMNRMDSYAGNITAATMFSVCGDRIGHLKLTTVLTLISRLAGKGYIKMKKNGRSYHYTPLVDEAEYKQLVAADFVSTMYKNDAMSLVSALVNDGHITMDDINELKRMIEEDRNR